MTQLSFSFGQRWQPGGRERRIPVHGAINAADFVVEQIGSSEAKRFVTERHYSRSMSSCIIAAGLFYRPQGGVLPAELVGVAVLGSPMTNAVIPKWTGTAAARGAELTRLVISDETLSGVRVAGNAESLLISRLLRITRDAVRTEVDERGRSEPRIQAIVTFADPVRRQRQDGSVVTPGHFGCVYQATNMLYGGRAEARTLTVLPDGRVFSDRTKAKILAEDQGAEYAMRQLVEAGAAPRRSGESPRAFVARAMDEVGAVKFRHPGNHGYALGLSHEGRKSVASAMARRSQAYPKARDRGVIRLAA